jgi:hypothetical protein
LTIPSNCKSSVEYLSAKEIIERVALDVADAKDNLMVAKISQSFHANKKRSDDVGFLVGDKVMLSTVNRRREYKSGAGDKRAAKFMPRFDGPYQIIDVHRDASTVTLAIPNSPNLFPTFHTSLVKPWLANDDLKYPSRTLEEPGPIDVDGAPEYFVDRIIDHKKQGRGYRFLVRFSGYGKEEDRWMAGKELEDLEALDDYLKTQDLV